MAIRGSTDAHGPRDVVRYSGKSRQWLHALVTAGITSDHDLERHTRGHLGKAEGQILYLRLLGMAGWAFILLRDGVPDASAPAIVYAAGFAYTLFAHVRLRAGADVAAVARITSIGDPLLVTAMCSVTGGIDAPFFPFYYFTLLATVFRYGAARTHWVLAFHAALIVLLFLGFEVDAAPIGDLLVALFHLAFSAALGAMLTGWAQENLDLALDRSRRAQSLSQQLIRTQEQERRAMAAELHDRMSGHLFALRQGVDELPASLARPLANVVDACSVDVRAMMNALHPTVLDDLGFCSALEEYVDRLRDSVPFGIVLHIDDAVRSWCSPDQTTLFRIMQEAMLNVRKHASATTVEICFRAEGGDHVLEVVDDGVGLGHLDQPPGRLGILTMRERVSAMGGRFDIRSPDGGGTRVRIAF